jgi:hypothetical protein
MKTKNFLTLLTLVCLTFSGCDKAIESKTETSSENTATLASLLTDDDCFDERMEKWFVEFNQLQDKGLDMNEANTKAIALVSVELKNCDEKTRTRTANLEGINED